MAKPKLPKANAQPTAEQWKSFFDRSKEAQRRVMSGLKKLENLFLSDPELALKKTQLWIEQLDKIPELPQQKKPAVVVNNLPRYQQKLIAETQEVFSAKFKEEVIIPAPHPWVTQKLLKELGKINKRYVFLPSDIEIRPGLQKDWVYYSNNWYYKKQSRLYLPGGYYLIDTTPSVDYDNGQQVYPDDPLEEIIKEYFEKNSTSERKHIPAGSRFATHPKKDWPAIIQADTQRVIQLGIPQEAIVESRLMNSYEFNAVGNLYCPDYGDFYSWVWFDDFSDDARLIGGHRDYGGLAGVDYGRWHVPRDDGIAGRPLVRFR